MPTWNLLWFTICLWAWWSKQIIIFQSQNVCVVDWQQILRTTNYLINAFMELVCRSHLTRFLNLHINVIYYYLMNLISDIALGLMKTLLWSVQHLDQHLIIFISVSSSPLCTVHLLSDLHLLCQAQSAPQAGLIMKMTKKSEHLFFAWTSKTDRFSEVKCVCQATM